MSRKNRNNSLRIKKSLQKTLLKTNEAVKAGKKRQLEAQKLKEKEEKERLEKERRQRILESLKEMSYCRVSLIVCWLWHFVSFYLKFYQCNVERNKE